jgi:hypothetical protein
LIEMKAESASSAAFSQNVLLSFGQNRFSSRAFRSHAGRLQERD